MKIVVKIYLFEYIPVMKAALTTLTGSWLLSFIFSAFWPERNASLNVAKMSTGIELAPESGGFEIMSVPSESSSYTL